MPKIAEVKFSSCGLEVADFGKNCDCRIAELRLRRNISLKLWNCDCGSASFKLRNCDCGLKKKLRVPTSDIYIFYIYIFFYLNCFWWSRSPYYFTFSSTVPQRTAYSEVPSTVGWGDCWIRTQDCSFPIWCRFQ
jgi:hypothetical protein